MFRRNANALTNTARVRYSPDEYLGYLRSEITLPFDSPTLDEPAAPMAFRRLMQLVRRYSISIVGPMSMSAAHFLSAVLVLHALSRQDFGLFSFVMTIVPFCVSAASALVGAPTIIGIRRRGFVDDIELATIQKTNLLLSLFAFCVVSVSLMANGLATDAALFFGLYGGLMSLRLLGRTYAFATSRPGRAAISDITYSVLVIFGLVALQFTAYMRPSSIAILFSSAALASMAAFENAYLRLQLRPLGGGSIKAYVAIWRDLTRWSLLGVVATELTVNAHAYLVTLISGPDAFAMLALGSLLMRPVSLVLSALPDIERPIMARAIGAGDAPRIVRAVREFRATGLAVLVLTALLVAGLLLWFPHLVLRQDYDLHQTAAIVAIWIAIMAIRVLRTPQAVFLQAAGMFQPLADASLKSCAVSLATTLALLLAFGPFISLFGIVMGDLVLSARIDRLSRDWKTSHG